MSLLKEYLIFLSATITISVYSQNFVWVKQQGGVGADISNAIVKDINGDVLTVGYFDGTADFDPGPGVFNLTSLGSTDVFVSRMSSSGNLIWAKSLGGLTGNYGFGITLDNSGNCYLAGYYQGTMDCDPGAGTFNITSVGLNDLFIVKLNQSGDFVWAKSFGGLADEFVYTLTIDNNGFAVISGTFSLTVDFDPGPGVANLTATGSTDVFVLKLDALGNFVWVKQLAGNSLTYSREVKCDATGNIFVYGWFQGTVDFNPGPLSNNLTALVNNDVYLLKLDQNGSFLWVKHFAGNDQEFGGSFGFDSSGDIYANGRFGGTCDFDPGSGIFNLTSSGSTDVFIVKLSSAGNFIWAKKVGGTNSDDAYSIAVDPSGVSYSTGEFRATVDFDPGNGIFNMVSAGSSDCFVMTLDAQGNFSWAKRVGGQISDVGLDIMSDGGGNVYTTGRFSSTADFDPGPGITNLTSFGGNDSFVLKLGLCGNLSSTISVSSCGIYTSPSGNYSWTSSGVYYDTLISSLGCDSVVVINLTVSNATSSSISTIACDSFVAPDGILYFASGIYSAVIPNQSGCDSVITINLNILSSTSSSITITACDSYLAPDGNLYTSSGIYTSTISNQAGCDSLITIDLTIQNLDLSVTNNSPVLVANQSGATYQWLDCSTLAPLPGATAQTFTASIIGNYAVVITSGGCTDTSACFPVFNTGMANVSDDEVLHVYPNPANSWIVVSLPVQSSVAIIDLAGRTLSTALVPSDGIIFIEHLSAGTYLLRHLGDGRTCKIIKQ
jgi:hypothetical protein